MQIAEHYFVVLSALCSWSRTHLASDCIVGIQLVFLCRIFGVVHHLKIGVCVQYVWVTIPLESWHIVSWTGTTPSCRLILSLWTCCNREIPNWGIRDSIMWNWLSMLVVLGQRDRTYYCAVYLCFDEYRHTGDIRPNRVNSCSHVLLTLFFQARSVVSKTDEFCKVLVHWLEEYHRSNWFVFIKSS